MKKFIAFADRLYRDEQGTEVLEYALLLGLVVIAALFVVTGLGTKVLAKWQTINWSL